MIISPKFSFIVSSGTPFSMKIEIISRDNCIYICITVQMYLLFTVMPVCIYNGKPSSLLSSGYVDDAFVVNVTTETSETAFSCASGFVMYFTADRKIDLCLCNVTDLRPEHFDFFFTKIMQNSVLYQHLYFWIILYTYHLIAWQNLVGLWNSSLEPTIIQLFETLSETGS